MYMYISKQGSSWGYMQVQAWEGSVRPDKGTHSLQCTQTLSHDGLVCEAGHIVSLSIAVSIAHRAALTAV